MRRSAGPSSCPGEWEAKVSPSTETLLRPPRGMPHEGVTPWWQEALAKSVLVGGGGVLGWDLPKLFLGQQRGPCRGPWSVWSLTSQQF